MGKRKRQVMEEESSSGISDQEVLKSLQDRTDICQRLLDAVKRIKGKSGQGKSGHSKYEFLRRLPSKRSNPEYYRVISEPISLSDIEQKLKTGVYSSVSLFVTDMVLMFNNAAAFYEEGSQEHDDAQALHEQFSTELRCIVREEDGTLSPDNKKLKLKISGGKIVSSSSDKESSSDTAKSKRRKQRAFSPSSSDHAESEGEGLIVQIKLPEQSESSASSEQPWKPKRDKQRKDYAELFGQRKMKKISEEEKKTMLTIYNKITSEKDEDGELMCEPFLVKPSARKYPHYYVLIKKPIDLQDIKEKIDNEKYVSVERFMVDINTLFRNAKFFNEETSTIYEHADLLYKVAKASFQQLTNPTDLLLQPAESSAMSSPAPHTSEPTTAKQDIPIDPKVGALFDEIKLFVDLDGRSLWETFAVVPNKLVNINYHNLIKQPMDMVTIAAKLLAREYDDVECIFDDFALMFDNTCRYYKSNTTQYNDAITLHKVLLRKRQQLAKYQPCVPCVIKHVQEILIHLVKAIMYCKDRTSGRRLSSSVWSVPPLPECEDESSVASVVDLVTIERRVVKGQYHRLDWLQDDIMSLLKHVQSTSTADDQVYKDAVRLQQVYLQERDRLCANGKVLWSPALSQYSLQELLQEEAWLLNMDEIIGEDVISQCLEESAADGDDDDGLSSDYRTYLECVNFSGHIYAIGDIIYVTPKVTRMCLPHIVAVERLWKDNSGDHWFSGSWFYRPEQTFHAPNKRFAKNEVFHTDCQQMVQLDRAVGKCSVLQYNNYCRNTVEGFDEEHTFVCREHYNIERKSFKPLKNWGVIGRQWKLVPREQPESLEYEYSKFATSELITKLEAAGGTQPEISNDDLPKDNEETTSSDLVEFHVEYDNVESKDQSGVGSGCRSYDQYCLDQYCFRLGDYVYLRSDEQQSFIARIEKMWTDENGDPWFYGCWFLRPSETVHLPTHLFYPNELLMSNIADTNPMRSVIGKCAVLSFKEYCTWRPTELDEKDVYLCEERYNEHDKDFKKLKSLKKFIVSPDVVPDEVYYFPEEVVTHKEGSPNLLLPDLPSTTEPAPMDAPRTSLDVVNAQSSSSSIATSEHNNIEQQPPPVAAAGGGVQPVMLFALDLQSQLRSRGVQVAFTSVVAAAKNEWSKLSTEQQEDYQLRATELFSMMPNIADVPDQPISKPAAIAQPATPPVSTTPKSSYMCEWEGCGSQFADVAGLFAHVTELGPGSHITKEGASNYYCEWKNCHRHKKSAGKRPFDTHTKLLRHLKEVHMSRAIKDKMSYTPQSKDASIVMAVTPIEHVHTPIEHVHTPIEHVHTPTTRLVSAFQTTPISFTPAPVAMETSTTVVNTITTNTINSISSISAHQQQESSPKTVKETPQILHTTVYTRYLEGLRSNKQHLSNWQYSQTVQQEQGMVQTPAGLQPTKWISPKAVPSNKNITDALYQLRDHLLQDTAKLSKYLSSH
ncbi:protein polybromo-1-like [Dysidea avara]|uniref:protein polybromo-1-like n=1 Tax=Dysidea avara TaxID=196820 RepID=UPI003333A458